MAFYNIYYLGVCILYHMQFVVKKRKAKVSMCVLQRMSEIGRKISWKHLYTTQINHYIYKLKINPGSW